MEKYFPLLKHTQLFSGIGEENIAPMLQCLQAKLRCYKKGEVIFRQGEHIHHIALLMEGCLHVQRDDYWGNRCIIGVIEAGDMFAESYAGPDCEPIPNDVVAVADSAVLFFDVERVLTVCSAGCRFHSMVVKNLYFAISEKNRKLMQKLGHMTKRTTREKLISYLSEEARRQNSSSFSIPFNRQQLADFLSVDRSAMSSELCKMRDAGLLSFEKSKFTLY